MRFHVNPRDGNLVKVVGDLHPHPGIGSTAECDTVSIWSRSDFPLEVAVAGIPGQFCFPHFYVPGTLFTRTAPTTRGSTAPRPRRTRARAPAQRFPCRRDGVRPVLACGRPRRAACRNRPRGGVRAHRNTTGETWKNSARRRMWPLLKSRFPSTTSEVTLRDRKIGIRSACRRPRCSMRYHKI